VARRVWQIEQAMRLPNAVEAPLDGIRTDGPTLMLKEETYGFDVSGEGSSFLCTAPGFKSLDITVVTAHG
jgi:hypothetical protein